jgi:hypothetical protein
MNAINTVCLCGSTRYLDDFATANIELTKRGFAVLSISMAMPKKGIEEVPAFLAKPGSVTSEEQSPGLKRLLDLVHLNKILRSDAVFVVGDGYIGESTACEILWAEMHGKPIIWQRYFGVPDWEEVERRVRQGFSSPNVMTAARKVLGL